MKGGREEGKKASKCISAVKSTTQKSNTSHLSDQILVTWSHLMQWMLGDVVLAGKHIPS
jgi:hypothetical protein